MDVAEIARLTTDAEVQISLILNQLEKDTQMRVANADFTGCLMYCDAARKTIRVKLDMRLYRGPL